MEKESRRRIPINQRRRNRNQWTWAKKRRKDSAQSTRRKWMTPRTSATAHAINDFTNCSKRMHSPEQQSRKDDTPKPQSLHSHADAHSSRMETQSDDTFQMDTSLDTTTTFTRF